MPSADVVAAVADAHRREWAFVLAATVRVTRDLDLAEECVQDAYAAALTAWTQQGVPARPGGWLVTAARNRALDASRRAATVRRYLPLLVSDDHADDIAEQAVAAADPHIPDDRLRLICTCCHPALAIEAQVALTLRLVCGLSTSEVAQAFLVSESTMAARITRAKKKIAAARIPFRVPAPADLAERIGAVLAVVHLLYTTGHSAPYGGELVRGELTERAVDLVRMLRVLVPEHAEVSGLLALMLLTESRRMARQDENGTMVPLEHQDRTRWDRELIDEGLALVRDAMRRPGKYALQAAIAALHAEAPDYATTDWRQIVGLYDELARLWPSPVVSLNRGVALGYAEGPESALAALDQLIALPQLAGYEYLPAARAHFLAELGRTGDARAAYDEAILLTGNDVERAFLVAKRDALG
ncbi:RNA polymerase sigma factor [Actinomadura harenae]|uniref:Sigma-70 family RNA polymerase sigma factor n=1 Tax=Actinomadura harenae TaxID=2483351 RepID=A0A3M2M597_9ACTN|nr:sigma-70 family RNA polymerase sigma factor [Actinomadura harenae]RMI44934.1 sigma-70 family RNA polymerase sigma factor [Actinomadura harenae]